MTTQHPFTLIGLTGLAGAGKDTVADTLREHCGAYTLAFADALRAEVANAFGVDMSTLTNRATKETPLPELALARCGEQSFVDRMVVHHLAGMPHAGIEGELIELTAPRSPRQIMQWWGTEYRRAQNPRYWTEQTHRHIARVAQLYSPPLIVLTDVRFDNEAAVVRTWYGQIWRIERPGQTSAAADSQHPSEATGEQFAPDVTVHNAGTLLQLKQTVLSHYAAHHFKAPGLRVELPA